MFTVKQSTAKKFSIYMGTAGLTVTATLSKDGGAFSSVSPTITDRSNGYYSITPTTSHRDTLGENAWLFAAGGATSMPRVEQVVLYDPDLVAVGAATPTDVSDTQTAILAKLPAALVGGRIDSSVGAMANNVLTAAAINADAITDAKVAADVTIASVTGAVGSVTAAIVLPTIPVDWITASGIATDAIGSAELAASAVTEIQSGLATPTNITAGVITTVSGNVVGSVGSVTTGVTVTTNNDKSGYALSGDGVDAVRDEILTDGTPFAGADIPLIVSAIALLGISLGDGTVVVGGLTNDAVITIQNALPTIMDVNDIKVKTDQFVFTVSNQVDSNALTGGGGGGCSCEELAEEFDTAVSEIKQHGDGLGNWSCDGVTRLSSDCNSVTADSNCSPNGVKNVRLPALTRGDTWPGIQSIKILEDGDYPVNGLASARIQFRRSPEASTVGHELTTTDGSLVIEDSVAWIVSAPIQPLPLDKGQWVWDYETTDSAGNIKTYLQGSITIKPDVTR